MKATFRDAAMMAAGMMLLFMLLCQVPPAALVGIFSSDPSTIAYGDEYLRITSWNYVASGLIFVASSMFQAMGNTIPSLLAFAARIALVAVPAVLMSGVPGFQLKWVWYLSVASVLLQLVLSMTLLRREFARKLMPARAAA